MSSLRGFGTWTSLPRVEIFLAIMLCILPVFALALQGIESANESLRVTALGLGMLYLTGWVDQFERWSADE